MVSQVSTLIHRPIEQVFSFVVNFENQAKWQAATVRNAQTTPGPMCIGAQCLHVGKWLGRSYESVGEVIEYQQNRKWGYKSVSGPYDLVMHYRFEVVGDHTRLTMNAEGDTKGFFTFFRFAEPLIAPLANKLLRDDLARLKQVLEGLGTAT